MLARDIRAWGANYLSLRDDDEEHRARGEVEQFKRAFNSEEAQKHSQDCDHNSHRYKLTNIKNEAEV